MVLKYLHLCQMHHSLANKVHASEIDMQLYCMHGKVATLFLFT